MRTTGDTPIASADIAGATMVRMAVVNDRVGAKISGSPALVGKRQALAPAAGTLGSANSSSGGVGRTVQIAIVQRQRGGFSCGIQTILRISTGRSKSTCFGVAVAAAAQALIDIAACRTRTIGSVAYTFAEFIRATKASQPGHGAGGRPSPVLEI